MIDWLMHPHLAFLLFVIGILFAGMLHPLFGIITILGGLLQGYARFADNLTSMNKKETILFNSFFLLLFMFMSTLYVLGTKYLI